MNNADSSNAMVNIGKITNALCRQTLVKALADATGPGQALIRNGTNIHTGHIIQTGGGESRGSVC